MHFTPLASIAAIPPRFTWMARPSIAWWWCAIRRISWRPLLGDTPTIGPTPRLAAAKVRAPSDGLIYLR